jgi:hypothetical protein
MVFVVLGLAFMSEVMGTFDRMLTATGELWSEVDAAGGEGEGEGEPGRGDGHRRALRRAFRLGVFASAVRRPRPAAPAAARRWKRARAVVAASAAAAAAAAQQSRAHQDKRGGGE